MRVFNEWVHIVSQLTIQLASCIQGCILRLISLLCKTECFMYNYVLSNKWYLPRRKKPTEKVSFYHSFFLVFHGDSYSAYKKIY